jgi:hypothetical protein
MTPAIVHGNRVSHHLGKDHRGARPRFDDPLFTRRFISSTFFNSLGDANGPFFNDRDMLTSL